MHRTGEPFSIWAPTRELLCLKFTAHQNTESCTVSMHGVVSNSQVPGQLQQWLSAGPISAECPKTRCKAWRVRVQTAGVVIRHDGVENSDSEADMDMPGLAGTERWRSGRPFLELRGPLFEGPTGHQGQPRIRVQCCPFFIDLRVHAASRVFNSLSGASTPGRHSAILAWP